MNILFASAEMSPLAKVGGLGDVAGSLPRALRRSGHDVRVVLPFYGTIDRGRAAARMLIEPMPVGGPFNGESAAVWLADVRGVPVYLIENERYFNRDSVYGHADDAERFLFFCDAVLAAAGSLDFVPETIHAQDWHTGLLFTRLASAETHPWSRTGRVYTIHNLALKGDFDRAFAERFALGARQFVPPDGLSADLLYSGMAQGIVHADRVNTVSDTYAREILTAEYGAGLDPLLRARGDALSGIVNGIDYEEFNPETDEALTANFNIETIERRMANKRALQQRAGLPAEDGSMLCGVVTRLWAQKGIDLVPDAFEPLLREHAVQLAVLGTGDEDVHRMLLELEARHPQKVKIWLDFDPTLGQQIYAGCDVFLMPSRYEPCGLGQMISLRYGAVPLVRRTGGLNDTVRDASADLRAGTGYVFEEATPEDLRAAVERALGGYTRSDAWRAMQERGMRQDWSWERAAQAYADLYAAAARDRAAAATA